MSLENNNNNDDKNKKEKKSLYEIMDKQGFYIILLLCVVIVASTAFWVNNQEENYFIGEGPTNPFEEEEEPEVTLVEDNKQSIDKIQETGRIGQGKPKEDEKTSSESPKEDVKEKTKEIMEKKENHNEKSKDDLKKDNQIDKAEESNEKNSKNDLEKNSKIEEIKESPNLKDSSQIDIEEEVSIKENMAMPVIGNLVLAFADDHLVYHKTLEQWGTHKGIDIQAKEGAPVKAALDGEVVEVTNDTIMGISIVIRHEDELLTIYSNLSTDAMVKPGEKVKKGQTISGVGKTASIKVLEGPLLHFQVLKDDKFVNPDLYLEKVIK